MNSRDMGTYIVQYGTNAERLALVSANIQPLTAFHETDTGNEYKWYGAWESAPGAASGVSDIVSLAPGTSVAVTGITQPNDFAKQFALTAVYADPGIVDQSYCQIDTNNIAGVAVQFISGTAGRIAVYGTVDGTVYTDILNGIPESVNSKTLNAPFFNAIANAGVVHYNVAQYAAIQIRCIAAATGAPAVPIIGAIRANIGTAVNIPGPRPTQTDSLQDTFMLSMNKIAFSAVTFAGGGDLVAINSGGKMRICEIQIECEATAVAQVDFCIVRQFGGLNTGGTTVSMDNSDHFDRADGFQFDSVTGNYYTAKATQNVSATRKIFGYGSVYCRPSGTPGVPDRKVFSFGGAKHAKELKLSTSTEQLFIQILGTPPVGFTMTSNVTITSGY